MGLKKPTQSRFYVMSCNIDTKMGRRLTATNMTEAKSEAVDIVRILLHNILSDL